MKQQSQYLLAALFLTMFHAEALAQRWGVPGVKNSGSSPDWTLTKPRRPVYSNSRSAAPRYDASLSGRQRHYSVAPTRSHYAQPPYRGTYRNGYHVQPYVNIFYNGVGDYSHLGPYAQQIYGAGVPGYVYGLGYPTISAPPIGVNYGIRSSATYQRVPVPIAPQTFQPSTSLTLPSALPANTEPTTIPAIPDAIPDAIPSARVEAPDVSTPIPVDDRPITNEFDSAGLPADVAVSTVDRIRSIRYQTSADDAFRRRDYASASALYEAASETAPDRPAPVLRQVWALVAQEKFAEAVGQLKKAMGMRKGAENIWIDGDDLYQETLSSAAPLHGDALWDWLQQRPNSTDRLLLGAAFQQMRGLNGGSRELLAAARSLGLNESTARSLETLKSSKNDNGKDEKQPSEADHGIRMKGSELVPMPRPVGTGSESSVADSVRGRDEPSTLTPVLTVPSLPTGD